MLVACKASIILFAIVWLYWTIRTIRLGFKEHERSKRSRRRWDPKEHRRAAITAYCFLWCTILSVGVSGFFVQSHGSGSGGMLLAVHLPSAILLLGIVSTMLFWKTGCKDARTHRTLARCIFVLSPIVFVTGTILFARL